MEMCNEELEKITAEYLEVLKLSGQIEGQQFSLRNLIAEYKHLPYDEMMDQIQKVSCLTNDIYTWRAFIMKSTSNLKKHMESLNEQNEQIVII